MNRNPFKRPGSNFGKTESEESRNLHNRDDADSSPTAHHHTLGKGSTQAAPGDHNHWQTGDVKSTYAVPDNIEWFELNGQASPTPSLAALFGPNLPDTRDHYLHHGSTGPRPVGALGGSFFSTIQDDNLPPHSHGIDHNHASFTTPAGGSHSHDVTYRESTSCGGPQNIAATGAGTATFRTVATTATTHTHDIDVPAFTGASSDGAFANDPLIIVPPHASMRLVVHV